MTYSVINYGEKMVNDLFDGSNGFAIDGGIKDSMHIRRLTTDLDSPMPALVRLSQKNCMNRDFLISQFSGFGAPTSFDCPCSPCCKEGAWSLSV